MNENFSKLQLWRDTTISYFAGLAGSLVVILSLKDSPLQTGVFWFYVIIIYVIVMVFMFSVTAIFRNSKS